MKPFLKRALNQLSIYLPVLLMGLMALATFWLVRSSPSNEKVEVTAVVSQEPDYFMRIFSVKNFNAEGQLESEIKGQKALHYPNSDIFKIEQAEVLSFAQKGQRITANANQAVSNSDGTEIQLFGDVVIVRETLPIAENTQKNASAVAAKLEFRGDFLHLYTQTEQIYSNKPVTLLRGTDQFTADSMQFDNLTQTLILQGRVKFLNAGNRP